MNNTKRFLDILIIFLLTILVFNLFFSPDKNTSKDTLEIWVQSAKYTIPASVQVLVQNYTNSPVNINTCNDISILKSGEKLDFWGDFCKDISVWSGKTATISYENEYQKFDKTWKYTLEAVIGEKKFLDQFEITHKWLIKKTFTWLIYAPIYNLVAFLIEIFSGSFWWAIVVITIIIRMLLYFPQQKMMISQKKIQAIQPKIEELKKQYKWDQAKLGQELMALYSKEKINPFGSLWLLFIQLPILLVVYNIIRFIQSPINAHYLYSFNNFSITDINFDFYWLDLLAIWWTQWIILAIIVALLQFVQIKISLPKKKQNEKWLVLEKKKDEKDYSKVWPDPEMMNKIMLYVMPFMVLWFTYSLFAALWLYWGVWTIFAIFQNLIVNKMFKK